MGKKGSTFHPSILNTVLGPITLGPSSSHLAGPVRLGNMARNVIDFKPQKVDIVFDKGSSFASTYKGHCTDCALVAGFMGWNTDNPKIPKALEEANKSGLEVNIKIEDLQTNHPNCVLFRVLGILGQKKNIMGSSEGGGAIRVFQIDDKLTELDGQRLAVLIYLQKGKAEGNLVKLLQNNLNEVEIKYKDKNLLTLIFKNIISKEVLDKIKKYPDIDSFKIIKPVFFIPCKGASDTPLFSSSQEMYELTQKNGIKLSQLAIKYEHNRLGWDENKIRKYVEKMIRVMKNAIDRGLSEELEFSGGIVKQGGIRLIKALANGRTISTGTLPRATAYAMAVNEVSVALGLIVAAPTAGACGVIPGALFAAAEEMGKEKSIEEMVNALLCAGALGTVFAQRATFLGSLCGCQVESGFATAMAAAAIVELKGGTVKESLDAASISLQNILGMECNPVAGLMEVPCINRNGMGAINALMSADIVLSGVESVIPLDEVIEVVYETGRFRPMQCNGNGGLAVTPTSMKILSYYSKKNKNACQLFQR